MLATAMSRTGPRPRRAAKVCWNCAWLSASGLAALIGCSPEEPWLLPGLSRVTADPAVSVADWVAEPIREYGSLDGPLQFSLPVAVTALPDGAIVVADAHKCALVIVERPSGRFREQWGRCGEGPGEFGFISAIAASRDSLFVYDHSRHEMAVWSFTGEESRRIRIQEPSEDTRYFRLVHIGVLDDTTLVASTEMIASTSVGLIDSRTGNWRGTLLGAPAIATYPDSPIQQMGGTCVRPGSAEPIVAILNDWAPEVVGLNPYTKSESFHYLTDIGHPPKLNSKGKWRSDLYSTQILCGASIMTSRIATLSPEDWLADINADIKATMVVLEARRYDGQLLMRQYVDDENSLLRAAPAAFKGDTLFAISHGVRFYPVVVEIVFRPNPRS